MNRKYKDAISQIHASEDLLDTVLDLPNSQKRMSGIPFHRWGLRLAAVVLLVAVLILSVLPKADTNLLTIAVMAEGQDPQYLEYMVDDGSVLISAVRPQMRVIGFSSSLYYWDPIVQQDVMLKEYEWGLCLYFELEISINDPDTDIVLEHDGQTVQAGNYKEGLALYAPVLDPETGVKKYTVWGRFAEQEDFTISVYHKDRLIQQKVLRVTPLGDPMEYFEYNYQIEIISNVDLR